MKLWITLAAVLVALTGTLAIAHDGPDNCRVILQTFYGTGKKRVEVLQFHTENRDHCKMEGMKRKVASESGEEEVIRVHVQFAYREMPHPVSE